MDLHCYSAILPIKYTCINILYIYIGYVLGISHCRNRWDNYQVSDIKLPTHNK